MVHTFLLIHIEGNLTVEYLHQQINTADFQRAPYCWPEQTVEQTVELPET